MNITVPDLPPAEWRVARPEVVEVTEVGSCEHFGGCDDTVRVSVAWPAEDRGWELHTCLEHAVDAVAVALDRSREDTQIAVSLLVCSTT